MNNIVDLVNKEVVMETVQLVEQKIKNVCVEQLEDKIKSGVSVGEYTITSVESSYDITVNGRYVCRGLASLDVAFTLVNLKIRNPSKCIGAYVKADHDCSKYKYDAKVYNHIIESSSDTNAIMIAEDRLDEALDRMAESKEILDRLKMDVNASTFDK